MSTPKRPKPTLPTVGELARRLNVPVHQIEYILRTRDIKPAGWAGNARVYTEANVDRVRAELARIEADREVGHG